MKPERHTIKFTTRSRLARALSAGLLWCWLAVPLFAGEAYLGTNCPDGIALLAPPPAPGSGEYAADLASARAVFAARTPAEEARAKKDASLSPFNFAPAIGDFFQKGRFPKLDGFFQSLRIKIAATIDTPKDYWKRARPCEVDSALLLGRPETSFSYPSGHSTQGTVQALLLAELFPEQREAILAVGRDIGWDRVLLGKHFPTDVQAGRVLAQAIVRELKTSAAFQHDFAEVQAEVRAAKLEIKPVPSPRLGETPGKAQPQDMP